MSYMQTILNGVKTYVDDKVTSLHLTEEDALIACYEAELIDFIVDSDNSILVDENTDVIIFN